MVEKKSITLWIFLISYLFLAVISTYTTAHYAYADQVVTSQTNARARELQLEGTQLQLKGDLAGAIKKYETSIFYKSNPRLESLIKVLKRQVHKKKETPDAMPQPAELLFNGSLGKQWLGLSAFGGNFEKFAHIENEILLIDVPQGNKKGKTGIRSAKPLIKVPENGAKFATKLTFSIDPSRTSDFVFALIPSNWDGNLEWRSHHIRVSLVREEDDKNSLLSLWIKGTEVMKINLKPQSLDQINIILRPDRLVLVTDGTDKIMLQGFLPDNLTIHKEGYRISVLTSAAKENMAAKLALRSIALERQPYEPVKPDADPTIWLDKTQKTVLFDGRIFDRRWIKYRLHGGDFPKYARLADGALLVDVPKGASWGKVGVMSPEPLVWLDKFGEGAEVRVIFKFDPDRTTGFVVALTPLYGLNGNGPSRPNFYLHWRNVKDGDAKAELFRNDKLLETVALAARAPETVAFILTPNGIKVEACGIPDHITPWDELAPSQSFRIYAYSNPNKANELVKMALKEILLERKAGKPIPLPKPAKGVKPLPIKTLFNGITGEWWEPAAIQIKETSNFIHFENGSMIADVPGKSNWERTGLLSNKSILDFNERILETSYKLSIKVNPEKTTGLQAMFYGHKVADMWKNSMAAAVSFTRHTQGQYAGKYVLELRSGRNDYRRWWRAIDADWVKKNWNGTLIIETGKGWMKASIQDGPSVRGTDLTFGKGNKLYMTIYAHPEKKYTKARLVLEKITGEWVMPDGMSMMDRWQYVDNEDFDADLFLLDLQNQLAEPETRTTPEIDPDFLNLIEVPDLLPPVMPPPLLKKQSSLWQGLNPISTAHAALTINCDKKISDYITEQRRIDITLLDQPDMLKSFAKLGLTLVGNNKFGADTAAAEKLRKQSLKVIGAVQDGMAIGEAAKAGKKDLMIAHMMKTALTIGLSSDALGDTRTFRKTVDKKVRDTWSKALRKLPPERMKQKIIELAGKYNRKGQIDPDNIYAAMTKDMASFDFGTIMGKNSVSSGRLRADVSTLIWTVGDSTLSVFSPHYKIAKAIAETSLDAANAAKAFVVNDRVNDMYKVWKEEMIDNPGMGDRDFYNARTINGEVLPLNEVKNMMRNSPDQKISNVVAEKMLFKQYRKWYEAEQAANKNSDRLSHLKKQFQQIKPGCRSGLRRATWPESRSAAGQAWDDLIGGNSWGQGMSKSWNSYWDSCTPEIELLKKYAELEKQVRAAFTKHMEKGNKCNNAKWIEHNVDRAICRYLQFGEDSYKKYVANTLYGCGLLTKKKKKCKAIYGKNPIINKLLDLNHDKLQKVMKALGIESPNSLYNCLCVTANYGSGGAREFYHPGTLGDFDARYSCQHPGEACIVAGYGCTRHPLPAVSDIWESCIKSNKIGMSKSKDGKIDPNSGEYLDDLIKRKLHERKQRKQQAK